MLWIVGVDAAVEIQDGARNILRGVRLRADGAKRGKYD
jgi:hypothetical protein